MGPLDLACVMKTVLERRNSLHWKYQKSMWTRNVEQLNKETRRRLDVLGFILWGWLG
jgi:hypothetical protein